MLRKKIYLSFLVSLLLLVGVNFSTYDNLVYGKDDGGSSDKEKAKDDDDGGSSDKEKAKDDDDGGSSDKEKAKDDDDGGSSDKEKAKDDD
ncbi:MAG: hypothetical protein ACE5SW_10600, partial [Nitrososphaeraceae archaeon]